MTTKKEKIINYKSIICTKLTIHKINLKKYV